MTSSVLGARVAAIVLASGIGGVEAAQAQALQGDRYGPSSSEAPIAPSYAQPYANAVGVPPPARAFGKMLNWPGKVSITAASISHPAASELRPVQRASVSPRPVYVRSRPADRALAAYRAPADRTPVKTPAASPYYGLVRAASVQPGQTPPAPVLAGAPVRPPQSIYDAPASAAAGPQPIQVNTPIHAGWAPPRRPWSGAYGDGVRLYSLHRAYGLKPDPAPIPPQFFAATADVSDPAGPIATRRTISGSGTAAQAERAVQASDADTPSTAQP